MKLYMTHGLVACLLFILLGVVPSEAGLIRYTARHTAKGAAAIGNVRVKTPFVVTAQAGAKAAAGVSTVVAEMAKFAFKVLF